MATVPVHFTQNSQEADDPVGATGGSSALATPAFKAALSDEEDDTAAATTLFTGSGKHKKLKPNPKQK